MYKNNPTSEATIKETATSIVEVFEKYLLSIDAIVPCNDIEEEQKRKEDGNQTALYGMEYWHFVGEMENWFRMLPTMCNINAFGTNNTVSGMAARHALSYFNNLLKEKALEKYKPTEVQNKKIVDNIQKILRGDKKCK